MVTVLAGVGGASVVAGLILAVVGIRGTPVRSARPPTTSAHRWWERTCQSVGGRGRWLASAGVTGLLVLMVTGWPVAALGIAGGVVWVPSLVGQHGSERVIDRLDALAEWTRRVADILVSGAGGLEQAITMSARTCPPAIAAEVAALAARLRPRGLEPALRAFAEDLADPMADRVIAALLLRARAGGRGLADVLDGLATSIAAEVVARRQVEADRAKPRTNIRSIIAITALVLAGLLVFAHDYLAPFGTAAGQLVLAVIVAVFAASLWWMHRLTKPVSRGRILGRAARTSGTEMAGRR